MYASTIHSFVAPGSQALRSAVNLVAARARQLHKRSSAVAVKVGLLSVSNKAVPCAPAAGLTKPQVAGPATWGVLFGTSGLHEAGFAVPLVAALTGLARGEAKPNPLIPADAPYSNPKAVDAFIASSKFTSLGTGVGFVAAQVVSGAAGTVVPYAPARHASAAVSTGIHLLDLKREHANLDRLEATHVDVTRLRECVNTLVDIKIGKAEVRTAYAAVSTTAIALAASGAGLPGTLATSAAALAVEARKMAVRYQSTAEVMEATMALHAAANAEQTAAGAYDPDAPATRIVTSLLKRNTLPGRMLGAYDVPAIIADKRGWNVLMSKAMNL